MTRYKVVVKDPRLAHPYVAYAEGDEWGARLAVTLAAHRRDELGDPVVAEGDSQAPLADAARYSRAWAGVPDGAVDLGDVQDMGADAVFVVAAEIADSDYPHDPEPLARDIVTALGLRVAGGTDGT